MMKISSWLSLVAMVAVLAVAPAALAASDKGDNEGDGRMNDKASCATCAAAAPCAAKAPSRCLRCVLHALVLVMAIVHVTLAIWVYGDVQKRGVAGRGIFIILALLAGIPATILYALVRIGDRCGEKPS